MDQIEIETALKNTLLPQARFALLYGSFGTERQSRESDIDIGVYFKKLPSFETRMALLTELQKKTGRDIDLVILNQADLIITMQILANGRLLFCDEQSFFNIFKAEQISRYLDFKMTRSTLEENFLTRIRNAGK